MTQPAEDQDKPKVSLLDVLKHLVQHSGGYPTAADRDAHVAALEEMAGDAVPDEGVEVEAPATTPAVAEPEDPRDARIRELEAQIADHDAHPEPVSGPVESATVTPEVHGDDGQDDGTGNLAV